MEAVGGYLDPYFQLYSFHNQDQVFEYLESMLIGYINDELVYENVKHTQNDNVDNNNNIFINEPKRSPILDVKSEKPFNAETPKPSSNTFN